MFSLLFFFLICIPVIVWAQSIEVPKPSRPGRITIPETIPLASTLQDVDDEIARVATIANATQLTVQHQIESLNPLNNPSVQNFPVLPVALGPTLEETFMYQNVPSLTSMIYPPQFLMASSPSLTSVAGTDEMVRLAHSGGGAGAAGGSFFGPNLLPPLGFTFGQGPLTAPFPGGLYSGQGPVTAPFRGPSGYQPLSAPFPSALLPQSGPIPPYTGIPNGQFGVLDPFYPFAPTSLPGFRGPAWYPPVVNMGYPLLLPFKSVPLLGGLTPNNPLIYGPNPSLFAPQPNVFPVPPPRLFW